MDVWGYVFKKLQFENIKNLCFQSLNYILKKSHVFKSHVLKLFLNRKAKPTI
jgi:hypothetical protein